MTSRYVKVRKKDCFPKRAVLFICRFRWRLFVFSNYKLFVIIFSKKSVNETVKLAESIPLRLRYAGYFMDFIHKYIEEDLKIEDAHILLCCYQFLH